MEKINSTSLFHNNIPIDEASKVGLARRKIRTCLKTFNFSENFISDISIIINELSFNLLKHALRPGYLLYKPLLTGAHKGIEIISFNALPLMNLKKSLEDGFSTTETLGTGLGAIHRLSDEFLHSSTPTLGTILISRKYEGPGPVVLENRKDVGFICTPYFGETFSGDAISSFEKNDTHRILMVDGLGHGYKAYLAARKAVETFQQNTWESQENILELMHKEMQKTRGAAVMIVDVFERSITYSSIGNISGRILSHEKTKGLISHPGIIGANLRKIKTDEVEFLPGEVLILHSDGIKKGFSNHMDYLSRLPSLVAASIYGKFGRLNDDASIYVFKKT